MDARTVLLVDEDPDSRLIYSAILEHRGYVVWQCEDGDSGLRLASARHPDLILADLEVAVQGGHRLTERLKRTEQTADIPLLAVTAQVMPADRRTARRDGCDGFLPKPFGPIALASEVERFIGPARPLEC